jgi:vancomycin resistance protein YoaR
LPRLFLFPGLSSIVSILLVFAFEQLAYRGRVLHGVKVSGVELSGFSRAEAIARIDALEAERRRAALTVTIRDQTIRLDPRLVSLKIDVVRTVDRALGRGRSGGMAQAFGGWAKRWLIWDDEPAYATFDPTRLAELVQSWEAKAIELRPLEGSVQIRKDEVFAEPPRAGDRVDLNVAKQRVLAALVAPRARPIELPIVHVKPRLTTAEVTRASDEVRKLLAGPVELSTRDGARKLVLPSAEVGWALQVEQVGDRLVVALNQEGIGKLLAAHVHQVETAPTNARFEVDARDRISIVAGQPAVRVDRARFAEQLLLAARSGSRSGELTMTRGEDPALSTEAAEKLGITGLVSSFTTRHECCQKRVKNIHRIADILDGTVVRPGETVSVNTLVGPRTERNGFVFAPTIEEGEMVDTPGGGVSQFATTLFNALFHGGYEIIERQPHTYWFARYPMGHEATLSWPKPDIVFRNDTDAGLLLKMAYTETSITVKLYGNNGGRKVRADVSARRDITEPPVELIPNPKLEPDREKVKEAGMVGWSVIVGRVRTFADGTTKEERRKVTYKPRVRRVEVHPCRIPEGEPGHTGERCPEPEDVEIEAESPHSAQ